MLLNVKDMIDQTSIFLEVNCSFYKMSLILCPVSRIATVSMLDQHFDCLVVSYSIATILVLYNAVPLDVSWAVSSNKVVAILESFFPAQVINYCYSVTLH